MNLPLKQEILTFCSSTLYPIVFLFLFSKRKEKDFPSRVMSMLVSFDN